MDYLKMIEDRKADFAGLYARMDKDRDLLIQKPFTLFDKDDREAPNVENLTLADAATFVARVESVLNAAVMTLTVEGEKLKDEEASLIENFFNDYLLAVDRDLQKRMIASLRTWVTQQICGRGAIASRVTIRAENDKFNSGILPLDVRYLVYDVGLNGLKWVSCEFYRSKSQLIEEYGEEIGGKVQGSHATVTDLYINEWERIFIGREQVKEQKHGYKELPFIIQQCPLGLTFQDGDQIANSGESLLYLARNLYEPKNKMASILDTLNMGSIFGGLQMEVEDVATASKPEKPPYGKRFVVPVQKGTKGFFPMPVNDIQQATQLLYSILDSEIQDATLPRVSYGTLQAPTSGIGIARLKQAEDPVYSPRLLGLSFYYERLLQMVRRQYIDLKLNVNLGRPGKPSQFSYQELDKDISVKVDFAIISPLRDMANISMVAAIGDTLSEDTKLRRYLQVEDPSEEIGKKWAEMAPKVSPAVAKYNIAKALADAGDELRGKLMAEEMGLTLDQLLSGSLEQRSIPPSEKPKQVIPLFGGGGSEAQKLIEGG